jgi:transcriptional regulator with XRE-family HTH domain
MPQLRIRELAEAQGLNISQLQRKADITMGTARRYWYATKDGKAEGPPLEELNLPVLKSIADVLGVKVRDLLSEEDWLALQPALA